MLKSLNDEDRKASDTSQRLRNMCQSMSISALQAGASNGVHAMLILATAANGLVHALAKATNRDSEIDTAEAPLNEVETLFAALLAYRVGTAEVEPGKCMSEFSPLVIFQAMKDVEKLIGQEPDGHLNQTMCRVARQSAADPAVVAQVGRERAAAWGGSQALN